MQIPFFHRKRKPVSATEFPICASVVQGTAAEHLPASPPVLPAVSEWRLYEALRSTVPVIDAAILKIVRLAGGFRLCAETAEGQALLDAFMANAAVNASGRSLQLFADQMLDSLLTYGNAVGELVYDPDTAQPVGLVTAHPARILVLPDGPLHCQFALRPDSDREKPQLLLHPERILFAALNPPAGSVYGVSLLRGLPAISRILTQIYDCIEKNYERAGNVRYAVTYHPSGDAAAFAGDHAKEIARAWQAGIQAARYGEVQDFVAVGDVDIKVIGAENPLFDTNIPVRQLLEQIVSKLCIPPFLLGFSWSSTERMSTQQADILTSELEYFRRLLTPMLQQIGTAVLHSAGRNETAALEWSHINLMDETELADARLKTAQAVEIELRNDASAQNT